MMRTFFLFVGAIVTIYGCKPRTQPEGALRSEEASPGGGGSEFTCNFEMPDGSGAGFRIKGSVAGNQLTNLQGVTTTKSGEKRNSSKQNAALVRDRSQLVSMFDKPLNQQKPGDRVVRDWGKIPMTIGDHLGCFDISGVGPGNIAYLCMDKSMQIASSEVLWVSDARYSHDLNVMLVDGTSCETF